MSKLEEEYFAGFTLDRLKAARKKITKRKSWRLLCYEDFQR